MTENETNLNVGSDIYMNTPYNGEQIRRAYETKPWKSDKQIYDDVIEEEQGNNDSDIKFVDLGLKGGLLWATCNLGASNPLESGKYYQWGDIEGYTENQIGDQEEQKEFIWDTYKYCNGIDPKSGNPYLTKYCNYSSYGYDGYTDDLTTLESSDDAATREYGNNWRIPTKIEFEDLLKETTHEFDSNGNLILTSLTNGNTIMFPASGIALGSSSNSIDGVGVNGGYWSSSLFGSNCLGSWCLDFSSGKDKMNYSDRDFGFPIRPVKDQ